MKMEVIRMTFTASTLMANYVLMNSLIIEHVKFLFFLHYFVSLFFPIVQRQLSMVPDAVQRFSLNNVIN